MKRAAVFVLALLFLCSCAAPKTGRVSEEELAKLREAYPYYDGIHPVFSMILDPFQNPQDTISYYPAFADSVCFAVIEVSSEPYSTVSNFIYPEPFRDREDFMQQHPELDEQRADAILRNRWDHTDAIIVDILWSRNAAFSIGETVTLTFSDALPSDSQSVFENGRRYVCVLGPYDLKALSPENPCSTLKYLNWHVTKNDVVLSATSEPGPDAYSGLYLESFKQEVLAILNEE